MTSAFGLVESDDGMNKTGDEVIKTQPTSAKSKISETISNKDMIENYVEDQSRRMSGKTNSHILSDIEDNALSINSTPNHLAKNENTSKEIDDVRSEIAQMQFALENVKKEMIEMQKQQKPTSASPGHQMPSRPPSVNSNKTFIFENDGEIEILKRPETSLGMTESVAEVAVEEELAVEPVEMLENVSPIKSRPPTAKSILKPESPFQRMATPTPDDVLNDDDKASNTPFDPKVQELSDEEMLETYELDEVDDASQQMDASESIMRSESFLSLSREHENDDDDNETLDPEQDYQQEYIAPPYVPNVQRTPSKVKRQPVLKRNHKIMPIKNSMPNKHPAPTLPAAVKSTKTSNVFPLSLRRFDRPKDAISTCLMQLDSSSWEIVMSGLETFVRLIRHHPEYVDAQIHLLTIALAKHVRNLRSQVSRAACSASNEFFMTNAKSLDCDAEELTAALLNRTADTNKFLRADADKALESMCDALQPTKVVQILTTRGATHQNAVVRCTTAKLLNQLVFRIGCDKVFNLHKDIRDRLILTGANMLMEGSLVTRNYTKEFFKQLSVHSHYQKLLLDVIPANIYRNIEKSLKSI